ncbi:MAG TPA: pyridoxal-dependent decarboxylase [Candidatus Sulfotelmatobacter sp.]|nr:pyridoxal-dependent decarboxylase [Candidatus Sulfotelmatobacter sp.]
MARTFHMTSQQFRESGKQLIDWLADYYEQVERYPVLAQVAPGEIRTSLPAQPPQSGTEFRHVIQEVNSKIMPGITHWQSPNFFAYFPANASEPSVLGDLLSSGLGVQGMLWATSPSCTEVETLVMDWLVKMLGLPDAFLSSGSGGGVIQDSASSSSLSAILAARERATGFRSNEDGCREELIAYTSTQAHSSIEKDVKVAGIGRRNLRLIDVDADFAIRPDLLEKMIEEDKRAGKVPFFVCATTGTTSSLAFDPLEAIGRVCKKHKLWLHVDAAMAGTAALCPEFRHIQKGLELADSYCFDAHKWMFTNFDCSCFFVANRETLTRSLGVLPEYLRNQGSGSDAVFEYRNWHVPLGRRFRALKLWFVIQHYGVEGLQFHVRRHVELAQTFLSWVRKDSRFELMAPAPLNLICFRLKGGDELNEDLLRRLNRSGKLYLSHTRLNGKYTIRFCVAQTRTELPHVEAAWGAIRKEADELLGAE